MSVAPRRSPLAATIAALIATATATAARLALEPAVGPTDYPFITFFPAIAAVTWRRGLGSGLLATVLGAVASGWFFFAPRGSLAHLGLDRLLGIAIYLVVGAGLALVIASLGTARREAEENAAAAAAHLARLEEEVAARRRAQDDLQLAIEARDRFLSMASHELRTPLSVLGTDVQLLGRIARREGADAPTPAQLAPRLERFERQVKRLELLVERMLEVSRIGDGRVDLELGPVDLAAVARDVIARHEAEIAASGSPVSLHAEGPLVGRWDALRADQIVTNLLTNAVKYGAQNPIDIAVGPAPGPERPAARLTVRDRGIGIAEDEHVRIFSRFGRAAAVHHHYGGFGLGLWIVREIVTALGGKVALASRPGEGTTVTVDLPLDGPPSHSPSR